MGRSEYADLSDPVTTLSPPHLGLSIDFVGAVLPAVLEWLGDGRHHDRIERECEARGSGSRVAAGLGVVMAEESQWRLDSTQSVLRVCQDEPS
ncbi:uncharacterized protein SAZU_3037 [Streptomyces azureus]|uniref:Uncharacterized protein n=1 Tax=Streptomyces azureus TaxID=146537 RepID=A0A0K8PK07_STRAJ|nr:uncharacterized protein SAZU_3037 [Streptomyces azureus]